MRKPKLISWIIIGIVVVAVMIVCVVVYYIKKSQNTGKINSYSECEAAGYPVQESFPEVCKIPGGKSFTNQ